MTTEADVSTRQGRGLGPPAAAEELTALQREKLQLIRDQGVLLPWDTGLRLSARVFVAMGLVTLAWSSTGSDNLRMPERLVRCELTEAGLQQLQLT